MTCLEWEKCRRLARKERWATGVGFCAGLGPQFPPPPPPPVYTMMGRVAGEWKVTGASGPDSIFTSKLPGCCRTGYYHSTPTPRHARNRFTRQYKSIAMGDVKRAQCGNAGRATTKIGFGKWRPVSGSGNRRGDWHKRKIRDLREIAPSCNLYVLSSVDFTDLQTACI